MKLDFCVACDERDPDKLEHHHLVPRSAGGSDDDTNLITLCHVCHGRAHGMERRHIRKLTAAGIARAKANGKKLGNPRMRDRDPEAIRKISEARKETYLLRMIETADLWLPIVQQMRPFEAWDAVAKAINEKMGSGEWNGNTLKRSVSRLASEGLADPALLKNNPRQIEVRLLRKLETSDAWLPIVNEMRPFDGWDPIAQAINERTGLKEWTGNTLKRAVSNLVSEGLADASLLEKATNKSEAYLLDLIETSGTWLPIVQQMRPTNNWYEVAKAVNEKTGSDRWNEHTLKRAVHRLASEGLADQALLDRAPSVRPEREAPARSPDEITAEASAVAAVMDLLTENPNIPPRRIAATLNVRRIPNTEGGQIWRVSMVNQVIKRAKAFLEKQGRNSLEPPGVGRGLEPMLPGIFPDLFETGGQAVLDLD